MNAQSPIAWGSPTTISADSDVITVGPLVGAVNIGGPAAFTITVNGVTFAQFPIAGSVASVGNFTLSAEGSTTLFGEDYPGPTGAGVSAEYSALAGSGGAVTSGTPPSMTLEIKNLVVGQLYAIQVWANVSLLYGNTGFEYLSSTLTATNSVTLRLNTSSSGYGDGRGQYAIGTFTAAATTESIAITGSTTNSSFAPWALISAVQVRAGSGAIGPSKLANISTRARVDSGDNALIAGVIIVGATSKTVIFRALGPSLDTIVAGALSDPVLDIYDHTGTVVVHNDNWRTTQEQEIVATGIPPTSDLESAIVATLPPGAYTAVVTGGGGSAAGVALVEVYDLD